MRSKQENNIQEKLCKKFVEGGGGFWQVQTQPLMDFLITPCHTVIGNHLPKAQQGQASVTYTLWPKKCCDHLVRPSAAATTATVSSSSIVGFCFTFFSLFFLFTSTRLFCCKYHLKSTRAFHDAHISPLPQQRSSLLPQLRFHNYLMRERSVITHLERIKPKGRQNKQYRVCVCVRVFV